MHRKYLGIDLGGTYIRLGLFDEQKNLLEVLKEKTDKNHPVSQIVNLSYKIAKDTTISGLGIGVPGVVSRNGEIQYISNIPALEGVYLKETLEQSLKIPVQVMNDCNVAALAEALIGAGKYYESVYYITISTGIGGGFVYKNQIISGSVGYAGEVGGIIVPNHTTESYRGLSIGAIESMWSGDALTEYASKTIGKDMKHSGDVFDCVRKGENWAILLMDQMADDLSKMFAAISFVINPEIFVLGGGCMKGKDCFLEKTIESYKKYTPKALHQTIFKETVLEDPGLIGAVLSIM